MSEFLEHARRGRNDWWRYLLTPAAALVLWILGIAVVYLPAYLAHLIPADFTQRATDPAYPAYFYGFTGIIFGALVLTFALAVRAIQGKRFGDIVGDWRWRQMGAGAGLWLVVCVASALIDYLVRPSGFRLTLGPATLTLALFAIPSLAIQTFCEEFLFRGYATQGLLLAVKRPLIAAAASGVIFGLFHAPNGGPQMVNAVVFGIVTALIVMRTGNLAFTWGLHLANNLFGAIVVVSTGDVLHGSPGVFTQATPDLMWLDVVASLAAFAAVWWLIARRLPTAAAGGPEEVF